MLHYEYCLQCFALKNDEHFGGCQYFKDVLEGELEKKIDTIHTVYLLNLMVQPGGAYLSIKSGSKGKPQSLLPLPGEQLGLQGVSTPGQEIILHITPIKPHIGVKGRAKDAVTRSNLTSPLTVYYSIKSCRSVWLRAERSYTHRQAEQRGKQRTRWSRAKVSACLLWNHDYFQKRNQRAVFYFSHSQYAFIRQVWTCYRSSLKLSASKKISIVPWLYL